MAKACKHCGVEHPKMEGGNPWYCVARLEEEVERYKQIDEVRSLLLDDNVEEIMKLVEAGRCLPVTANGVRVVPEVTAVYHRDFKGSTSHICSIANGGRALWGGGAYERPISECHSTLESLHAAAGEGEVKDE